MSWYKSQWRDVVIALAIAGTCVLLQNIGNLAEAFLSLSPDVEFRTRDSWISTYKSLKPGQYFFATGRMRGRCEFKSSHPELAHIAALGTGVTTFLGGIFSLPGVSQALKIELSCYEHDGLDPIIVDPPYVSERGTGVIIHFVGIVTNYLVGIGFPFVLIFVSLIRLGHSWVERKHSVLLMGLGATAFIYSILITDVLSHYFSSSATRMITVVPDGHPNCPSRGHLKMSRLAA